MENDSCALDPELLRFARLLPKVEIFDVIHQAVCDLATVQRIAQEALEDMAADGVLYAELRTTPRPLPDGTSRRCYVEGVLAVFRDFERKLAPDGSPDGEQRGLIPRLLLSASRAEGLKEAEEMTALALDMARHAEWGKYVLGVDFSGNPRKGSFTGLRPAFDAARRGGLKVSLHCGEVTGEEEETQAMIDFRPDRLGHAILLGEHTVTQLLSLEPRIPIEICPTSNRLTLDLDNHGEHPTVPGWIKHGYPFSVNTDDPGVFETNLSSEYAHLAKAHGLDKASMAELACRALEDIFDDSLRPTLRALFEAKCQRLLESESGDGGKSTGEGRGGQ